MKITILVSTYNWPAALEACLESVLGQTCLPCEIVIADDGSKEDTSQLIKRFSVKSLVPVVHIWHPDEGFRLTSIRNKGIAAAQGDYIIQIDGDVVLEKHFIADHIRLAEKNFFVCGSRIRLDEEQSRQVLLNKKLNLNFWNIDKRYLLNSVRLPLLSSFISKRYQRNNIMRLRGCNMAFWRDDLIEVNGYNEDLTSWGHEDSELAYRLIHAGKKKKYLKFGGIVFHLHHKENEKNNENAHYSEIERIKSLKEKWCNNGISQYL